MSGRGGYIQTLIILMTPFSKACIPSVVRQIEHVYIIMKLILLTIKYRVDVSDVFQI